MIIENRFQVGDVSDNGQVTIVDEDRLCYLVRSESRGAVGLRTISKAILNEFVAFSAKIRMQLQTLQGIYYVVKAT